MMAEVARPATIGRSFWGIIEYCYSSRRRKYFNTYLLESQDQNALNIYNTTEFGTGLLGGDISLGLDLSSMRHTV